MKIKHHIKKVYILSYCNNIDNWKKNPSFPNLGDAVQTIAMTHLLPNYEINYINRYQLSNQLSTISNLVILNGWHGFECDIPETISNNVYFIGFHTIKEKWIKTLQHTQYPIGCRDKSTFNLLTRNNVPAYLSGCVTLMFEKYVDNRYGKYTILDYSDLTIPNYEKLSHRINYFIAWEQQLEMAKILLEKYKQAEHVITDRLHVYLPCLAFGTPVTFHVPERNQFPLRLEIIDDVQKLGIEYFKNVISSNIQKILQSHRNKFSTTTDT